MDLVRSFISIIFRPSRVEATEMSSDPAELPPVLSLSFSKRSILAFCLVERALAPRRIHASSVRSRFLRFCSAEASRSSRSAFSSRNRE
ncbi:hypothetical protein D3C75_963140 [compost metagenome]